VIASRGNVSLLPPIGLTAVPYAIDGNYLDGIVYLIDDPVLSHTHTKALHRHKLAGTRWPRVLGQTP